MATYIPGVTDYVSQFQPFTPDYNFLGNILQQRQSTYDANYKALNQKYGTLLNSNLLREDSLVKRDQFFKMIDQDIKKMSGLDLSLQQNVDASNKVFDSFYQNKDLFKDMVYTKEYQRQLQIADSYKNCIDQEKCGGKYWDVGVNYLNYRAEEFKNASKEDMMSMSPGEYIPQINIQEKAMKIAKDLGIFGDKGGITKMTWNSDGRYQITLKNGQLLQQPLHQLLKNMLGKDQAVIDMYKAQAYVRRKDFINTNIEKFGGDENLAEDEYFRLLDVEINEQLKEDQQVNDDLKAAEAKKEALKKTIEKQGTTGTDDLGIDYAAAGLDYDYISETAKITNEQTKIAKSIFDAGSDRKLKRARVDSMYANALLNREMFGAATGIAATTGSIEYKEDPYAKSAFDFSLEMQKLERQYDLMDRNAFRQSIYELSKEQALGDYVTGGSMIGGASGQGGANVGTPVDFRGSSTASTNEYETITEAQQVSASDVIGNQRKWVGSLIGNLENTINNSKDANSVTVANNFLTNWVGKAQKDASGNIVKEGYDPASRKYYVKDPKGRGYMAVNFDQALQTIQITDPKRLNDIYRKGINAKSQIRSLGEQKNFFEGVGRKLESQVELSTLLVKATEQSLSQNLSNIKNYIKLESEYKSDPLFDAMFESVNGKTKLVSKEKFKESFSRLGGFDESYAYKTSIYGNHASVDGIYNKYLEKIQTTYNKNPTAAGKPLVQPLYANPIFANVGGGTAGQGFAHTFNTMEFRSEGYQGTLGFINNYLSSGDEGLINLGLEVVNKNQISDDASKIQIANRLANGVRDEMLLAMQKLRMKKKDFNPEMFTVKYADLALSDNNKIGLHIQPTQKWIEEQFTGKEGKELLEANPEIYQGFTMYIPKSKGDNNFTQSFKYQPYDVILQHTAVDLELPNAGKVKINKRNPDGSYTVSGNFMQVENGKLVQADNWVENTPPLARGQAVYETFLPMLEEINRYNTEMLQSGTAKVYNTDLLSYRPDGSLILASDPDKANQKQNLAALYQQNVERNLQMFGQQ